MHLLGLCGYKKSGKDEVCKILIKYLAPRLCYREGFADALKEELAKACGVTTSYIEQNKDVFRPALQWWGTDFRRNLCGEDYWIEKWLRKVTALSPDTHLVVVPDVRFANEAKAILQCGGTIWRVVRTESYDKHESESNITSIPFSEQIENTWTLEALESIVIKKWKHAYPSQQYNT